MDREDRMRRAEDYVFGLMSERERERAERDMLVDADFRDSVMALAERLRTLNREKQPALSDATWGEIAERIARMPQMGAMAAPSPQAATAMPPAPDPARKGLLQVHRPFAHQFAGWRGTVVALCLIAAMAVGYLAGQAAAPAPQPLAVAVLAGADGLPGAIVEAYAGDGLRVLPLGELAVPAGKVLQLWTTPAGAAAPVPLGTLAVMREMRLTGPELPAPAAGQSFRVTLEDAPGSATGRPQGDEVLSGIAVVPPR